MTELEYSMLNDKRKFTHANIDPRTKLFLLVFVNIILIFSKNLIEEFILECSILLLAVVAKKYKFAFKMFVIYSILVLIQIIGNEYLKGIFNVMIVTFVAFIRKLIPCGTLGGIIVSTTKVNEFMTAMNRINMPKAVVIPIAIMLRYFPTTKEDYKAIIDAMKMRGIAPNIIGFLKNPIMTIECIYVPLIMGASKVADELSAAAISRGIENPKPRTCMQTINYSVWDAAVIIYFIGIFTGFIMYNT